MLLGIMSEHDMCVKNKSFSLLCTWN